MAARQSVVKIYSCFNEGMTGVVSEIEVSLTPGLPYFDVIGLCDSSIRESRGRIKAALISSGFNMPKGHITVGISPAYMHKSGSSFDLPISLGILFASNQLKFPEGKSIYAEGELSFEGMLKGTPGSTVRLKTQNNNYDYSFIPTEEINSAKCSLFKGCTFKSLREVADVLINDTYKSTKFEITEDIVTEEDELDFSMLKGQSKAQRAMLIAASGRHNLLLLGSSGCGKSLAGKLISGILPPLSSKEIGDVYSVNEIAGNKSDLDNELVLSGKRPVRFIHPGVTKATLLGNSKLEPGELVLANHGILFADEITEFKNDVIESLRIPLEEHIIIKQKDGKNYSFPASFIFIAAGNPCKCGNYFDDRHKCICTEYERKRYLKRLSGPFLDRIDLFSEMRSIDASDMKASIYDSDQNLNSKYKECVLRAWEMQKKRYSDIGVFNGTISEVNAEVFRASKDVVQFASEISEKSGFSGRGFSRIIKVSRTIADIDGREDISSNDVLEAAIYRQRLSK